MITKEQAIEKYDKLIWKIAHRQYDKSFHSTIEINDLVQEGYLTIVKCVGTYKHRSASFMTYLYKALENNMRSACYKYSHMKQSMYYSFLKSDAEEMPEWLKVPYSLDVPVKDDSILTGVDILIADNKDYMDTIGIEDLRDIAEEYMVKMSNREQMLIREIGFKNKTLKSISQKLNITKERVRQIYIQAISKLYHLLREDDKCPVNEAFALCNTRVKTNRSYTWKMPKELRHNEKAAA